jgi:hypothetical protein
MFAPTAQVSNVDYSDAESIFVEHRSPSKKEYALYAKAIRRRTDITDGAKLTYLELIDFDYESKQTGTCKGYVFPKTEKIAELRGVSERAIREHIKELISVGVLSRVRRKNTSSVIYIEDVIPKPMEQHTPASHSSTAKICRSSKALSMSVASHQVSFQLENPERQKSAAAYIDETTRISETTTRQDAVAEKLERLKISPNKAHDLAERYSPQHIEVQVCELERRLRDPRSCGLIRNPGGWLIAAIERVEVSTGEVSSPPRRQALPVFDERGNIDYYEVSELQEIGC